MAPSGTLRIQGRWLHAWAGLPGRGRLHQAALLAANGLPSSSLPLGLGLTPSVLGFWGPPGDQAYPQALSCAGQMAGMYRTSPQARLTTWAPEASEALSSPASRLVGTQC